MLLNLPELEIQDTDTSGLKLSVSGEQVKKKNA